MSVGLSFRLAKAVSFLTAMQGIKEMCPAQFAEDREVSKVRRRFLVGGHGAQDDETHIEWREALERQSHINNIAMPDTLLHGQHQHPVR